jgi:ubiquinone/menaquinone biosynthesis C-methylase UbiE
MTTVLPYLMESADETARLEAKTDAALTERLLRLSGLGPGMRALDAGAGTGAVARVMSQIVGSAGSVVAMDRSEDRLAYGRERARELGIENLTFEAGDLETGAIPGGPYDFVWCRFVFEYLKEPDVALEHLVEHARVGGTVVVGDGDGHGAQHFPIEPEVEAWLARVFRALEGQFDPYAGRKLYHRFKKGGLGNVRVHVEPYHLYAGVAPAAAMDNWEQKFRMVKPKVAHDRESAADFERYSERFLSMLRDENVFTYSVLLLVSGTRLR